MCLQRVAAGVRHTLSGTANPLAGIFLLAVLDVLVVYVLDEPVHVAQIADLAALPGAHRDLLLELVIVGPRVDGRAGHTA